LRVTAGLPRFSNCNTETRGSPDAAARAAESSLDPSSAVISSKFWNVCASALFTASWTYEARFHTGTMLETRGVAELRDGMQGAAITVAASGTAGSCENACVCTCG